MEKVILGCYKDNVASASTILKNGGILTEESCNCGSDRISQYYTVTL